MLNKTSLSILFFVFFSLVLFQNCEKKTDPIITPAPASAANEITDTGGLKITITYDKTPADVDLDLYLYRKSTYSATVFGPLGATIGANDGGVVSTTISPSSPDDELVVVTAYATGIVAKNYFVEFKGVTNNNSYALNGIFAAGLTPIPIVVSGNNNYFGTTRGKNINLKKVGNTYTITQ